MAAEREFYAVCMRLKLLFLSWENFTTCKYYQNKETDLSRIELVMIDPTTVRLKGTFDLNIDIERGPLRVNLQMEKQMPGNYMPVLSYELKDICEKLGEPNQSWSPYISNLIPTPPKSCPIQKNTFNVEKVQCDTSDVELKREMIGKYRARVEMYRPDYTIPESMPTVLVKMCCYYVQFSVQSE